MQLLEVDENTTLSDLSKKLGDALDSFLHLNGVSRTPNVGKAFQKLCDNAIQETSDVSYEKKASLLNGLTTDSDIFEKAALLAEDGWKILSSMNVLPGSMKVPDGVVLPDSTSVMGNGESVPSDIYNKVMKCLKNQTAINPSIFNGYNAVVSVASVGLTTNTAARGSDTTFQWFKLPWGMVTLHSSLDDSTIDFPVYPEELSDARKANFTQMPEQLYQYEPWQLYQSSGPREHTYNFHFHRDIWTGDHRDGKANELIRACEANCYPEFKGSAVNVSTVTLYIAGQPLISGVMTNVTVDWSGPLGLDDWYLECKLGITITEVSKDPLNFQTVKNKGLIG